MSANTKSEQQARREILDAVKEYAIQFHSQKEKQGRIPYAGRVYDEQELIHLVDSALDFWLTAGRYTDLFETKLADFLGVKYCSFVNSGSSANLLAFMALTSPLLGERAIARGDEVITVACGFPTTVAPILQYGAVPVFVDVTLSYYNVDVKALEQALSPKTRAVMLAHTLGNPFALDQVAKFCKDHNLWLIEDNCDALGAKYLMNGKEQYTGTVGDIGTSSFYPAHHITTGEGGAVYTNSPLLHKIIRSLRDWGRDCVCPSGHDNFCGHRFDRQYGELPLGYDHKYVYSHFGYNLKATDLQAAIGCAQLEKLSSFIEKRNQNFRYLYQSLAHLSEQIILPQSYPEASPSWFGFPITCREKGKRDEVVAFLEQAGIQTRMLFAGNLIRHPCFDALRAEQRGYRVAGELKTTDEILTNTFWIGVYPGLSEQQLEYMSQELHKAFSAGN